MCVCVCVCVSLNVYPKTGGKKHNLKSSHYPIFFNLMLLPLLLGSIFYPALYFQCIQSIFVFSMRDKVAYTNETAVKNKY